MKPKLMVLFLLVGMVPLAVCGLWSAMQASDALMQSAYNQLTTVREIKKGQIQSYFAERQGDMGVLVDMVETVTRAAYRKINAIQELKRAQIETYFRRVHNDAELLAANADTLRVFRELKGYYDLLSIGPRDLFQIDTPEYRTLWEGADKVLGHFAKQLG